MGPYDLNLVLGDAVTWLLYLLFGFGFGFILESTGFGDARKLAAQFYWRDLTVIKVMFTAIVVCMTLLFWATALGWLDYDQVWVNPTYLWPGLLGGFIMGLGFIIGGYCPGTSLVSMATAKIDGMFFVLGVVIGVFLFGETVSLFNEFWHSGDLGRYTLADWLRVEIGTVVLIMVSLAIIVFWLAEKLRHKLYGSNHEEH